MPLDLYLFALNVRENKQDVLLFFTSWDDGIPHPIPSDSVYVSGRLDATVTSDSGGTVTATVLSTGPLTLSKSSQPDKGVEYGDFSIAEIIFTPDPD